MDNELKKILFDILASHSELTKAEYRKNIEYNNEHYSYKPEENALKYLDKMNLTTEFFKHIEGFKLKNK